MKKKIISTLGTGIVVLSLTGCVSEMAQMAFSNGGASSTVDSKKSLQSSSDSSGVQASDGTTNTAGTVTEGAAVGAGVGAVVGKKLGVGAGAGAVVGGLIGGIFGKKVDDNNKKQAEAEKKIADETADYEAKTAELEEKMK